MDKIFWGIVLILLDFNFLNIDILPDFIGYGLIYLGTESFLRKAYHFNKIRPFLLASALYDLVIFVNDFLHLSIRLGIIGEIINLVFTAFTIYIIYSLIEGIRDLEAYYRMDLRSIQLNKYFMVVMMMQLISNVILFIPIINLLVLVMDLVSAIVGILFIVEFHKTRILFRNHFLN